MSEAEFEEFNILQNEIDAQMDADAHTKSPLSYPPRTWYTIEVIADIYRRMLRLAKYEVTHV